MTAIILASASPRRRELIHQIGWTADIEKSCFHEVSDVAEAEDKRKKVSCLLTGFFFRCRPGLCSKCTGKG